MPTNPEAVYKLAISHGVRWALISTNGVSSGGGDAFVEGLVRAHGDLVYAAENSYLYKLVPTATNAMVGCAVGARGNMRFERRNNAVVDGYGARVPGGDVSVKPTDSGCCQLEGVRGFRGLNVGYELCDSRGTIRGHLVRDSASRRICPLHFCSAARAGWRGVGTDTQNERPTESVLMGESDGFKKPYAAQFFGDLGRSGWQTSKPCASGLR